MASPPYGHRKGTPLLIQKPVAAASAAIVAGDFLSESTAGYVAQAAAGGTLIGIAWESVASPSANGDSTILVDVSTGTVYEYPPDTGTVTAALMGRSMDIGGAQSVDIDASTDDVLMCHEVDTVANTLRVSMLLTNAGVV